MDNFEDENFTDDFEIEFSDLPLEEESEVSTHSSRLRVKIYHVILDITRRLSMARTWLLSETLVNKSAGESSKDEIELEIVDLPGGGSREVSRALTALGSRLIPRRRLWRLTMAGSTVLLALLLFLGSFPSTRDLAYKLFAPPTPIPTNTSALTEESSQIGIIGVDPDTPTFSQATVVIWDTNATPGPIPQGQSCLASPVHGFAHEIGRLPVLAVGFDGPRATLHLSPIPVPVSAFPHKFGWAASITLETQGDYAGLITVDGGNLDGSSPLVFGFGSDPSQGQLFSLTLSTQQSVVIPGPTGISKARRTAWNITVYVPAAGCYFLRVAWPGGGWMINFAAGR